MESPRTQTPSPPLVLLLFFLSGGLALLYQVIWARIMTHTLGSTALAVGTVLAAYMAGLAMGSWLAGRVADRSRNRLRLYALLEVGIAAAALVTHLLLSRMDALYPALTGLLGTAPLAVALLRFVLVFLCVMAPTLLMGATLPVLTRFVAERPGTLGGQLGGLYAVNTFGAVCGALLTGFFLIGRFGIHTPVYGAVIANLLVGAVAWFASRATEHESPDVALNRGPPAIETQPAPAGIARLVVIALGLSGFTSFAYEIYWTRSLVFTLGNSTYALTTMLCAFLTGIALGSYLLRFLLRAVRDQVALFAWIQVLLGMVSAIALPIVFALAEPEAVGQLFLQTSARPLSLVLSGFAVSFSVMLAPAVLIGMTFPLAASLVTRDTRRIGTSVGRVYAVNTVGNVLGALLPGLILLEWLGIQGGIVAMAALNFAIGLTLLAAGLTRESTYRLARLVTWPLLLAAGTLLLIRTPADFEFPSAGERAFHQTLFYREGPLATTKVFQDPVAGEKLMSVDGIIIGGTGNTEFKQLLLAHLPKLLLDNVASELTVGMGSGMLAGESALHPGVREITGVEIEPSVLQGAAWFREESHDVLQNPKLRVVEDDIGNFLRTTRGSYQVISADEKTADEYASNGFSYSREYYRLLLDHLAPDGLVAQWVPTTLPPRQYRMILKTFGEVFPHIQLWYFLPAWKRGPFNTILVGSHRPIPIDPARIRQRYEAAPEAFAGLRKYGITGAEALIPHFVTADDLLRQAVEDAEINSLDHPRYEFYKPWDYARERAGLFVGNHQLIIDLKRAAYPAYLEALLQGGADSLRTRRALAAEDRYLQAFSRFLTGIPLDEIYRIFDDALQVAPWNDSLRARIYAQYRYLASANPDPAQRAVLMRRAEALYDEDGEP